MFYKISRPYSRFLAPEYPSIWASTGFGVLILLNLFTAMIGFRWLYKEVLYSIIGLSVVITFIFRYYFGEKKLESLEKKYWNEPEMQKQLGSFAVALYVIGTFLTFILVVIDYGKTLK